MDSYQDAMEECQQYSEEEYNDWLNDPVAQKEYQLYLDNPKKWGEQHERI